MRISCVCMCKRGVCEQYTCNKGSSHFTKASPTRSFTISMAIARKGKLNNTHNQSSSASNKPVAPVASTTDQFHGKTARNAIRSVEYLNGSLFRPSRRRSEGGFSLILFFVISLVRFHGEILVWRPWHPSQQQIVSKTTGKQN